MENDRIRVSIDFKLSKNYNSVGGSMSYESSSKGEETPDDLFNRVYNFTNDKVEKVFKDAKIVLIETVRK